MQIQKPLNEDRLINTSYRNYAMYTLESRAIPSAIDGFKMVHRKIMYFALERARNKKTKVADFGSISSYGYNHGEVSAQAAAVGLASDWNNNVPLLTGYGDFGSRLSHTSAAPRYIYAKLSDDWDRYFESSEVCPDHPDIESPEPAHYLPVIPWILVNGSEGIAVAFACKILPRDPKDIASYCRDIIDGKTVSSTIHPTFPNFKGSVHCGDKGSKHWIVRGSYSLTRNTYRITELPVGWDREKYVEFLTKLLDSGKIKDFSDLCDETGFVFEVKTTGDQKTQIEKDVYKFFRLETHLHENLTTLDAHGKVRVFGSVEELVRYFIAYRLSKYNDYITFMCDKVSDELSFLENKKTFIVTMIGANFNSITRSKMIDIAESICGHTDSVDKLIAIPVYAMTSDEVAKLDKLIVSKRKELKSWNETGATHLFSSRLKGIVNG